MALKKTQEIDNLGIEGNYHRVVQFNINFDSNDTVVTFQMYKNKATRDAGKNPTSQQIQREMKNRVINKEVIYQGETLSLLQVLKKLSYIALKEWATEEAAKQVDDTTKDNEVAFFVDATDEL